MKHCNLTQIIYAKLHCVLKKIIFEPKINKIELNINYIEAIQLK